MKNTSLLVTGFLLALVGGVSIAAVAHAGPLGGALSNLDKAVGPSSNTGLSGDLTYTVGTVVRGVLALVGTIFFILTIYAGILWMTAMGNGEQVEKSRSIITAAIIGLAITLSAYAITYFVGNKLGSATNSSTPSGKICAEAYTQGVCAGGNTGTACGNGLGKAYDTECTKRDANAYCCYFNQ